MFSIQPVFPEQLLSERQTESCDVGSVASYFNIFCSISYDALLIRKNKEHVE